MALEDHPTIKALRAAGPPAPQPLSAGELKELAIKCGAHDVGLVEVERPALADERQDMERILPGVRSVIGLATRLNRHNVRSPHRSLSDREFLSGMHAVDDAAIALAAELNAKGWRALYHPAAFPMDVSLWPNKMWQVALKLVAQAGGLGKMGKNRLLLHPRFGAFVGLGAVLTDWAGDEYDQPLDYNPCLGCGLCVAACPVGAIGADGYFNFINCMTHNYRDRMGGFVDLCENLAASSSAKALRRKVKDAELISMWQSLSYGICNKSTYCMAVCPAGQEVAGGWLKDKAAFKRRVLEPLTSKEEDIYVVAGTDAQAHVRRRFAHKNPRLIHHGVRPSSAAGFLSGLRLLFQPGQAGELSARYHFTFTGAEEIKATVTIDQRVLSVEEGLVGKPDLGITVDAQTWVSFLRKDIALPWALITRRLKLSGPPKLMKAFAGCFPV